MSQVLLLHSKTKEVLAISKTFLNLCSLTSVPISTLKKSRGRCLTNTNTLVLTDLKDERIDEAQLAKAMRLWAFDGTTGVIVNENLLKEELSMRKSIYGNSHAFGTGYSLESLQKRKTMLEGQLAKVNERINNTKQRNKMKDEWMKLGRSKGWI